MKLGLMTGAYRHGAADGLEAKILEAERLGYNSIWLGETYGPDCFSSMAYWAAKTTKIKLGTSLAQIWSRTPTATAMSALTIDNLSGGRFVLGLGVSGPQVVEGWFGQPFAKPLAHTREYVEIVRSALSSEAPVRYEGKYYQLPAKGGTGLGKALRTTLPPVRPHMPIYIGAEGPKNVAMMAEIADGWIATYLSPKMDGWYRGLMEEGFARRTTPKPENFEVVVMVSVSIADTVEEAADKQRPHVAMYVGGMGAPGVNFHYDAVARLGYEDDCARIQERWMSGDRKGAAAAVPTRMIEDIALVGPPDKIKADLDAWRETVATTLLISGDVATVRTMADLVLG